MRANCTTADMLSALRNHDGMTHYVVGSPSYLSMEDQSTDLCEHLDVLMDDERTESDQYPCRYRFHDGSAIVACDSGECWDVGYEDCFCGRDSINPLCPGDHS